MKATEHADTPDWRQWRDRFAKRRGRPLPDPFAPEPRLAAVPPSVARSLAIFQLGESGGGRIVEQARSSRLPGVNRYYADALALFVAEEHHHAELLACGVRMLGGSLLRENWTARLFVVARRLMGLRFKVTVLLVAEIIGICYYHLLASRLPPSDLRSLLETIVDDELSHLDFHCSFLRVHTRNPCHRTLFRLAWRLLTSLAAIAVFVDHRRALRDLGIRNSALWRRWMSCSRAAEALAMGRACRRRPAAGGQSATEAES